MLPGWVTGPQTRTNVSNCTKTRKKVHIEISHITRKLLGKFGRTVSTICGLYTVYNLLVKLSLSQFMLHIMLIISAKDTIMTDISSLL